MYEFDFFFHIKVTNLMEVVFVKLGRQILLAFFEGSFGNIYMPLNTFICKILSANHYELLNCKGFIARPIETDLQLAKFRDCLRAIRVNLL